ncbi:uncharacterized protein LOC117175620 [Belonocnema kinseyi]|uniref:uncharacterized protein LOC117175620 n=1 Tax=Belonocnema kinseyi TaxID=2817044 RepID=UPI00143CE84E|nr:uncharacterized protein LOC117175620 [Belonocnema kinseyi]
MSSSRSQGYKRYLEPGSEEPIPPSSSFRYKKLCTQQNAAESSSNSIHLNEENDAEKFYEAQGEYAISEIDHCDITDQCMALNEENNSKEQFQETLLIHLHPLRDGQRNEK